MKAAKALVTLYDVINQKMGPIEAKESVTTAIYNVISELQERGLPITEKSIELMLSEKANDYLEASKNQVA